MDLQQVRQLLQQLAQDVQGLRDDLNRMRIEMQGGTEALGRKMKARGLQIHRTNPRDDLLIPPDATPEEETFFYHLLTRYSFRLFLRDVIRRGERMRADELVRYCSLSVCQRYLASLVNLRIIEQTESSSYRLRNDTIHSFGPTLEWFVAEMWHREFASPAYFGVTFRDTASGGDYDVVALWEGYLVYVEIKSSPPRGIERSQIGSFFARIADLLPDVAFLFNDTQLRMRDKLVPMVQEYCPSDPDNRTHLPRVDRVADELFHIGHRIYIVNSKKDAVANFAVCLRDFLAHRQSLVSPIPPLCLR